MQDDLWEVMRKLAEYRFRREQSWNCMPISDCLALDREIERLEQRQRELMGQAPTGDVGTTSRSDSMQVEIEAAQRELGDRATPSTIMRTLKGYAGKPDSCITGIADDGILWKSNAGELQKLTMSTLKKRLARHRRRPAKSR